jgi:tripartite-type tricarboxylate transporter receptor subunit TctC
VGLGLTSPGMAQSVEEFYKSRPITIVLGYTAGGGFDLYARVLAKYLGKYIPGNPQVLIQNMPGAGSLTATNYTYNVAPKDGSVITLARAPVVEPVSGGASSQFDALKFTWIGNGMTELTTCALLGNPQVATMEDATKHPFTLAGLGPGSDEDMFTKLLTNLFGWKSKLVTGYPGGAEEVLAVERGEVDGRCGWSYSSLMIAKPQWVHEKRIKFLTVLNLERSPLLPETPSVMEFATNDRQKRMLKLVIGCQLLGRPIFAPPGVPADRAAALRAGFEAVMNDPAYIAERKAFNEDVTLTRAQDIEGLLKDLFATPKELIDETRSIITSN